MSDSKDEDIDIEMITVDINQVEILARASKEHAALILQAIGLTSSSDMTPLLVQALARLVGGHQEGGA